MRLVVADDSVLLREGLVRLFADAGFEVLVVAGNADASPRARSPSSAWSATAI